MRRLIKSRIATAAVCLALLLAAELINPASAADKGEPAPAVVDARGEVKNPFTGCYGQAGVAGLFADSSETLKTFAIGAGCDWQVSTVVIGASAKMAFGQDDARALTVGGRIGYTINPHTLAYAHAGFLMDGKSPNFNDSVVMGGLGLETYLNRNLTVFLEAATDLGKWSKAGDFTDLPRVYEVHGGIRIRF